MFPLPHTYINTFSMIKGDDQNWQILTRKTLADEKIPVLREVKLYHTLPPLGE